MNSFTNIIGDWHFWALISGYWVFSNAVGAMPLPQVNSNPWYAWAFKFLNGLAANLSRAVAGKIPGLPLNGGNALNGQQTPPAGGPGGD